MNGTTPIAVSKFDGTDKVRQTSANSKDAFKSHENDMHIIQNVRLIWLDSNINDNDADHRNTRSQLRSVVNTINTFTDPDQCMDFLTDVYNENVFMIISGALCRNIVPVIHSIAQIQTIVIFCRDKTQYEQWAKCWPKIKGVFTDILLICKTLMQATKESEQNAIPMSIIDTHSGISKNKMNQLEPSYMYTQILKEILLSIKFEEKHFIEFIDYCRDVLADNESQLRNVDKLQRKYRDETPIRWYTYECFLYPMLNRALRLMNVDVIIKLGFFIVDLHCQIEELHKKQFGSHNSSKSFTVYRGQGILKTDFEQIEKNKNGLISFNNFLSTSKNLDVSLRFAKNNLNMPDLVGILFVMTIDPTKSSAPFASVNHISQFEKEDEILFSMHTVFRVCLIRPIDGNHRLFQVDLRLINDNENDLRVLTDYIREETFSDEDGWFRLGSVLMRMGEFEKVQQIYENLLKQATNDNDTATIYHAIGSAKSSQAKHNEAINFYEKSLEIHQKKCPPNYHNLARSHNSIGLVYYRMGAYSKALSSHEKALEIRQKSLRSNHPDLAMSYNNIGLVYHSMGEYSKALSSYIKALEIRQQLLPSNHPDLAIFYNNIGTVHINMSEYSMAASYYEKALKIQQQSLPSNHPNLAMSYNNIGLVYYNMDKYAKALSFHAKAFQIRQQSLDSNHPDLATSYNNIGLVYHSMGKYSKALLLNKRALRIRHTSLPPNHLYLATSYNSIGMVYDSLGEYSKALSSYEKVLEIQNKSLPSDHPDIATSHSNIGSVYKSMCEYWKALFWYEKALQIRQQSLSPNRSDLARLHSNIGSIYYIMHDYSKALSFYEKECEIRQQSLPPNHSDLAACYNNMGLAYECMGNYSRARSFYERALDLGQQLLPPNHPILQQWRKNLDRFKKRF